MAKLIQQIKIKGDTVQSVDDSQFQANGTLVVTLKNGSTVTCTPKGVTISGR